MCVAQAKANAKLRDELNEALVIEVEKVFRRRSYVGSQDWQRHGSGPRIASFGQCWMSGCIRNKQLLYNICLETC